MATIMGHELGHLAKGHVRAKIEREKALGLLGMMAGFAFDREMARKIGASSNAGQNFAQFAAKMISAQFDRDQEREADAIGVAWMYKAGYDPSAALRLWQRMPEGGGLLSDHPASSERYQLISMQIASFPGQQGSAVARVPLPAQSPSVKTTDYREPTYGPGDPYTMMMVAYNQGRYQEAFSFAMMSAAARDPRGQAAVGMLYRDGVGTDQDYAKAEYYYGLAAAQGSAVANNSIATLIMDGHSSIKDPTVAAAYYQKAADANYPGALAGLGIMKISGTMGIPQDETGGRALLLRASDANDPLAAWFVATAIIRGQTMQKDYTEAFRLMSIAWQGGVNLAGSDLALMYARGQGVAQSIPKAKGLLEASFKDGNAIAAYYLGVMYKDGEGVPADKVRAYAYLDLAVKMGARNAVKMRDTRGALLSIDEITQALSLEQILQPRKTGIYRTKG
jgi:TPR repeat protein